MSVGPTIDITVNGVDKASNILQQVGQSAKNLNNTVAKGGETATNAGKAVSAASSIATGSLIGLASGFRQLHELIKKVGTAGGPMGVAIAAAATLAIAAWAKAIKAFRDFRQAQLDLIKTNDEISKKQHEQIRELDKNFLGELSHSERMARINAELADGGKEGMLQAEGKILENREKALERAVYNAKLYLPIFQKTLEEDRQRLGSGTDDLGNKLNTEGIKALQERVESREKQIELDRKNLKRLEEELEYLRAQKQLNSNQLKEVQDEKAFEKLKAAAEEWLKVEEIIEETYDQLTSLAKRRDAEIDSYVKSSFAKSVSTATSGAKSVSLEEVAKVTALQAAGFVKASATGYTTSQGDAMREAEDRARRQQYQDEMLSLVRRMEQKAGVQQGGLNINVMDF